MKNKIDKLPNKCRKRIIDELNKNGNAVVVRKNGEPRVFNLEKYIDQKSRMSEWIKRYKPWEKRRKSLLGPIGEKPLGVAKDLSRVAIYEGR